MSDASAFGAAASALRRRRLRGRAATARLPSAQGDLGRGTHECEDLGRRIVRAVAVGALLTLVLEFVVIQLTLLRIQHVDATVGPDGIGLAGVAVAGMAFVVAVVGWPLLSIAAYVVLGRLARRRQAAAPPGESAAP